MRARADGALGDVTDLIDDDVIVQLGAAVGREGERAEAGEAIGDTGGVARVRVHVEESGHLTRGEHLQHAAQVEQAAGHEALRADAVLLGGAAAEGRVHDPVAERDADRVDTEGLRCIERLAGVVLRPVVGHRGDGIVVAVLLLRSLTKSSSLRAAIWSNIQDGRMSGWMPSSWG